MVEKNRHMKLMIRTFNRKTSFTQKYYITFILKAVFSGEIVNLIGHFIRRYAPEGIYLSLNNWDH